MIAVAEAAWVAFGSIGAAVVAAVASVYSARQARRTHNETKSPNGIKTGELTYDLWKRVQGMEARQGQLAEFASIANVRQFEILDSIAQHSEDDAARFAQVFERLDRIEGNQ